MFAAAPKNRGSASLRRMIFFDDVSGAGDPTALRASAKAATRRTLDMMGGQ